MSGAPDKDQVVAPVTPAAEPAAAVAATPTAIASPVAQVPETPSPAPAAAPPVVETPAAAVAAEVPAAPAVELAKPDAEASLLDAPPAVEAKPADAVAEAVQPDQPVVLPTYEAYTLPEGVTLDETEHKAFNEMLGGLELAGKVDHAAMQEFGQKAINFHLDQVQKTLAKHEEAGAEAWKSMRDNWRNEFKSDREIGGNRQQTTLAGANAMIEQFGGSKDQIAEMRRIMRVTGAGDNVHVIRFFANVAKVLGEGRPVPANNPKPPALASKKERRYHANGAA